SGGRGLEGYRHSYVEGMRSIVTWAGRVPVGTLVYTSSTSVYPQSGGARVDEEASVDATRTAGSPIVDAEDLLLSATIARRRFILRLGVVCGPARLPLLDLLRDGAGELRGGGTHRLNLVHRDDIVSAIQVAFDAPEQVAGGVFNVADDGPAPKADVMAFLAEKLGRPTPRFSGEPAHGRRRVTPDRVIVNEKIKRMLGWRPRYPTYREGYAAILGA